MASFNFSGSFQSLAENLQNGLQEGLKEIQGLGATVTPIAKRTTRLIQEKLGSVDDVSQLPQEYVDLEKKVDALKVVYKKLLSLTSHFENENYDYPPNLRETFVDFSKNLTEKVQGLSNAATASEAEAVLNSPPSQVNHRTFNHAIARAAKSSVDIIDNAKTEESKPLVIGEALAIFADLEEKLGDIRLAQDDAIKKEFNAILRNTLQDSFQNVSNLRKKVENSRLTFDTLRFEAKSLKPEEIEEFQPKLDAAEDELVANTAAATSAMSKLIEPTEGVNLLVTFIQILKRFHQAALRKIEDSEKELTAIIQ